MTLRCNLRAVVPYGTPRQVADWATGETVTHHGTAEYDHFDCGNVATQSPNTISRESGRDQYGIVCSACHEPLCFSLIDYNDPSRPIA